MKLFMLQDEINRLSAMFSCVAGQIPPEAKPRDREPMKLRGGVATIKIKGPLYPKRVSWLDYWGEEYAIYSEIISDIAEAKFKGAKHIDFEIDSPGGYVEGLYDAMKAISDAGIRTRTIGGGTLASAAYMLAAQTHEIFVDNPASTVGSIGIATSFFASDYIIDITNRDSKKKRPDPTTEEGKAVVEDELDDFWGIYAEMIAKGRRTTVDNIKKNYGQGAVMTARTALSKGMIDEIMQSNQPAKKAASIGAKSMDFETLKTEHPALFNAVFSLGKEAGSKEERDRVCAHLKLAEGSGDMKTAHDSIVSGEGITATVTAAHLSASMMRRMRADRMEDNPPDVNTGGSTPGENTAMAIDAQAKIDLEAKYGKGILVQ